MAVLEIDSAKKVQFVVGNFAEIHLLDLARK